MDIIFQSGDFYNQSDFLSSVIMPFLGILIPALIAVSLFNIGIKKERELDNEKREMDIKTQRILEEERRENDKQERSEEYSHKLDGFGNHFKVLLDCCIETSKKQVTSYKVFVEEFMLDILGAHHPMQYTHEDLNRLLRMDLERILEFFESVGSDKNDFTNAIHQLDYLNIIFQKVPEDLHEGNGKFALKYSNDVIRLRELILKIITDHLRVAKQKGKINELLNVFFNQLIIDYYKDINEIPYIQWDYEKLIIPLRNELVKPDYLKNELVFKLMEIVRQAANTICTIKQINEGLCSDITMGSENIEGSITELTEIYKKLSI